ncbi:MAG: hypothetical protein ACRC9P_05135, partial [Bacteroides sp.]
MELNKLIREAKEFVVADKPLEVLEAEQLKIEELADGYEREMREGERLKNIFTRPVDDPLV